MLRLSAFLLPAALLLLSTAAQAQTPPQASGKSVTFTVINGDFLTTLVRLERQYHIQCVLRDGVNAHAKINMSISEVPLSLTLRLLASAADAEVTQSPRGVYMFTPKSATLAQTSDYTVPPPHFTGGFGSFCFGSSLQQSPVVFLHNPPMLLSDMLNGRTPRNVQPGEVQRIFAVGTSF